MKKIITTILAVIMLAAAFAACRNDTPQTINSAQESSISFETTTTLPEEFYESEFQTSSKPSEVPHSDYLFVISYPNSTHSRDYYVTEVVDTREYMGKEISILKAWYTPNNDPNSLNKKYCIGIYFDGDYIPDGIYESECDIDIVERFYGKCIFLIKKDLYGIDPYSFPDDQSPGRLCTPVYYEDSGKWNLESAQCSGIVHKEGSKFYISYDSYHFFCTRIRIFDGRGNFYELPKDIGKYKDVEPWRILRIDFDENGEYANDAIVTIELGEYGEGKTATGKVNLNSLPTCKFSDYESDYEINNP